MAEPKDQGDRVNVLSYLRLVDRNDGGGAPNPNPPAQTGLTSKELGDFLGLASRIERDQPGERDLFELEKALIDHPGLWRAVADLASHAIDALIEQTHPSTTTRLSLRRGADELQATLAGPDASPLESALAEQIAVCWVRLRIFETTFANATARRDRTSIRFWEERVTSAQRRYQSACESLARIRRLARRTPALLQVNIGAQQVNVANAGPAKPRRRAAGQAASPGGPPPVGGQPQDALPAVPPQPLHAGPLSHGALPSPEPASSGEPLPDRASQACSNPDAPPPAPVVRWRDTSYQWPENRGSDEGF